jgi:hypothetical protein
MQLLVEFVIIFVTTETLNTIDSRTLVLAFYGGGKLRAKFPSPETLRGGVREYNSFFEWDGGVGGGGGGRGEE